MRDGDREWRAGEVVTAGWTFYAREVRDRAADEIDSAAGEAVVLTFKNATMGR